MTTTVPRKVTVRLDTGLRKDVDRTSLLAAGPKQTVRTLVNIEREPESYDLTLRNIGRDGTLTGDYYMTLLRLDGWDVEFPYERDGSITLRLPRGDYLLQSVIRTGTGDEQQRDLLAYPDLRLNRDLTIDLDARMAEPIHLNPPNPDTELVFGQLRYHRTVNGDLARARHLHRRAVRPPARSVADRTATAAALFFYSMPTFLLGLLLLYFLFYRLQLAGIDAFPPGGYVPLTPDPAEWARHLVLPWLTLALVQAALYVRLTRGSLLDVLGEDFIRTARAKGLRRRGSPSCTACAPA